MFRVESAFCLAIDHSHLYDWHTSQVAEKKNTLIILYNNGIVI